jgi:hypothetical protein
LVESGTVGMALIVADACLVRRVASISLRRSGTTRS